MCTTSPKAPPTTKCVVVTKDHHNSCHRRLQLLQVTGTTTSSTTTDTKVMKLGNRTDNSHRRSGRRESGGVCLLFIERLSYLPNMGRAWGKSGRSMAQASNLGHKLRITSPRQRSQGEVAMICARRSRWSGLRVDLPQDKSALKRCGVFDFQTSSSLPAPSTPYTTPLLNFPTTSIE